MKFSVLNDTLCAIYKRQGLSDEDTEFLVDDTLEIKNASITPAHFIGTIEAKDLYEETMSDFNDHMLIAAPIGGRDYLEFLREKMIEHPADHSRSVTAIERMLSQGTPTFDLVQKGVFGVYHRTKPNISRPLSLDDPDSCAKALEGFEPRHYDPRIIKFLARFEVEWPSVDINVEPVPPDDEMILTHS